MASFSFHYKYSIPSTLQCRFYNGYLLLSQGSQTVLQYNYKPGDIVAGSQTAGSMVSYLRIYNDYHDSSFYSNRVFYTNRELPGLENYLVASDTAFKSYSINFGNCTQNSSNSYNYTCLNDSISESSENLVTSTQTSSMGSSLVNAGSGLLHIGIQLLPYAIGLTLIMIIFLLIKRWSNLKTNWQLNRIKRQKTKREREEIRRYSKKR